MRTHQFFSRCFAHLLRQASYLLQQGFKTRGRRRVAALLGQLRDIVLCLADAGPWKTTDRCHFHSQPSDTIQRAARRPPFPSFANQQRVGKPFANFISSGTSALFRINNAEAYSRRGEPVSRRPLPHQPTAPPSMAHCLHRIEAKLLRHHEIAPYLQPARRICSAVQSISAIHRQPARRPRQTRSTLPPCRAAPTRRPWAVGGEIVDDQLSPFPRSAAEVGDSMGRTTSFTDPLRGPAFGGPWQIAVHYPHRTGIRHPRHRLNSGGPTCRSTVAAMVLGGIVAKRKRPAVFLVDRMELASEASHNRRSIKR